MIADLVEQVCTTAGVGSFQLQPPTSDRVGFVAGYGSGNDCVYHRRESASLWELGYGKPTAGSPDTLSRDLVLNGSSGPGVKVNFTGAASSVTGVVPAELLGAGHARLLSCTTTGSANAYAGTVRPAPRDLTVPLYVLAKANFGNTGACTFNLNGKGALPMRKGDGTVALAAGDWPAGMIALLALDTGLAVWQFLGQRGTIQASELPAATTAAQGAVVLAMPTETLAGTDAVRAVTPDALAALWERGADVASAATISLGDGGSFSVTGSVTITDIDFATDKAGRSAWLRFTGTPTVVNGANLQVFGGANWTAAAGDMAFVYSEAADLVRVIPILVSGKAVVETPGLFKVGAFTRDTSLASGNQAITGVGFQPKAVVFLACVPSAFIFSVGLDTQAARESIRTEDATTFTGVAAAGISLHTNSANVYSGAITTLDADGFTVAWTRTGTPTGLAQIKYLAMR